MATGRAGQGGILITGVAGFIGFHLAKRILASDRETPVVGVDNRNDAYSVALKDRRLAILHDSAACGEKGRFSFVEGDLSDKACVEALVSEWQPRAIVHLAAQAGVRRSISDPDAYVASNLVGFFHVLEACRHTPDLEQFVFASSSSVYGNGADIPFSTHDAADRPVSFYAATKRSNELMAYAYAKLYGIPTTGLRFFSVYGPYGRPDMAYYQFADAMREGRAIPLFNGGEVYRDFTYIDDVIDVLLRVLERPAEADGDDVCYRVYNVGNADPTRLTDFVQTLESCLRKVGSIDRPARYALLPMQPGDVYRTFADVSDLVRAFGYRPETPLSDGLGSFAAWYKAYQSVGT